LFLFFSLRNYCVICVDNWQIGDFGLATTGTGRVAKKELREFNSLNSSMDSHSSLKESLTIGVGTPFYCSPEQLKAGTHYDQKVDLYSLGIILFEMCHPITTGMERAEVRLCLTILFNNSFFLLIYKFVIFPYLVGVDGAEERYETSFGFREGTCHRGRADSVAPAGGPERSADHHGAAQERPPPSQTRTRPGISYF
jgi:hypothetical protein